MSTHDTNYDVADIYHVGVVVEQTRETVVIASVRAHTLAEAQRHALRSVRARCDEAAVELDDIDECDWYVSRYSEAGLDRDNSYASYDGKSIDFDLTDEPTDIEADTLRRQVALPLNEARDGR